MPAPVGRPAMHPVRVHTPPADAALEQPGEQVATSPAIAGRSAAVNVLSSDEVRLAHQGRMRGRRRDRQFPAAPVSSPSGADCRIPAGSTPACRCSAAWRESPRRYAASTYHRRGAGCAPDRPPKDTAHPARSTPERCSQHCDRPTAAAHPETDLAHGPAPASVRC